MRRTSAAFAAAAIVLAGCSAAGPPARLSASPPTLGADEAQAAVLEAGAPPDTTVAVSSTATTAPPEPEPEPTTTTPPAVRVAQLPATPRVVVEPGSMAERLACLRSYEQGAAGYATETGNGYSGAYQYVPSTWAWAASGAASSAAAAGDASTAEALYAYSAGRASAAPDWAQDMATAWALRQPGGPGNWPTMRYCGG